MNTKQNTIKTSENETYKYQKTFPPNLKVNVQDGDFKHVCMVE
jgi:hypothetical protein